MNGSQQKPTTDSLQHALKSFFPIINKTSCVIIKNMLAILKIVPSIDVSKCKTISNSKKINETITEAFSKSIKVKVNPVRYNNEDIQSYPESIPSQFFKITSLKKLENIKLVKEDLEVKLNLAINMKLEIFIESKNEAYYFIGRVLKIFNDSNSTAININFPKTIYEIKRRDYFRFSPPSFQPIRIEFNHSDITYDFFIEDISAGGLSIKFESTTSNPFEKGDFIENMTIFFKKETLTILSSRILRSMTTTTNKKQYIFLGFEFINLKNNIQDRLIKNIFEEHREHLNRVNKE